MKINKFDNYIKEALVHGAGPDERLIDLRGPGGNAYAILGMASNLCNQLKEADPEKYDWERINKEMTSGDYKNLVNTFEEYFGDYVNIYNADVLDESMVNEEFNIPIRKRKSKVDKLKEGPTKTNIKDIDTEAEKGPAPPPIPQQKKEIPEGYDLERFYSVINKLDDKGQKTRKNNISNLFFRKFLGKELLNSTIDQILVDVNIDNNHYGMSIFLDDGSKIHYNFEKEGKLDHVSIEPNISYNDIEKEIEKDTSIPFNQKSVTSQKIRKELKEQSQKVSRKDARLIGQIVKKFNPDTKYAVGTGDLVIKEYESRIQKFDDFLNE